MTDSIVPAQPAGGALSAEHYQTFELAKENDSVLGGDNIACVSIFGFPEKMNEWAPAARERIENELLKK